MSSSFGVLLLPFVVWNDVHQIIVYSYPLHGLIFFLGLSNFTLPQRMLSPVNFFFELLSVENSFVWPFGWTASDRLCLKDARYFYSSSWRIWKLLVRGNVCRLRIDPFANRGLIVDIFLGGSLEWDWSNRVSDEIVIFLLKMLVLVGMYLFERTQLLSPKSALIFLGIDRFCIGEGYFLCS